MWWKHHFFSTEASQGANLIWENGVENGLPFLINESNIYYVSANLNNCISQESVMIELISNVKADFDYTLEPYSNSELKGYLKTTQVKEIVLNTIGNLLMT